LGDYKEMNKPNAFARWQGHMVCGAFGGTKALLTLGTVSQQELKNPAL